MKNKALILTTTEPGNTFPENFSCWCAGALEARGCPTALETVNLDKLVQPVSSLPLQIKDEQLSGLRAALSVTEKVVFILPEYNNMLPLGLDNFINLVSAYKTNYKFCKLIAIVMDNHASKHDHPQDPLLFSYPLHALTPLFGESFTVDRIKIKNSPTGNMCPLFQESYKDLCHLVQQILD